VLSDLGFEAGSKIILLLKILKMQINIKTPINETITLKVNPTDTIANVKKQIQAIEGSPVD
jgi:hypothetical protein